jgi:hypothetical protein
VERSSRCGSRAARRRLAAAAIVCAGSLLAAGEATSRSGTGDPGKRINFLAHCRFSHMAPDDPIVYPGQPGRSHDHTFFGNTSTDAFSTLGSLRAAKTTCDRKTDTASYWVPTLFRGTTAIKPLLAIAYYTVRIGRPVRPYPPGLKMVAGNAHAVGPPQSLAITWWSCGAFGGAKPSTEPPARCRARDVPRRDAGGSPRPPDRSRRPSLELHVRFPDCWDARRLDSLDHRSHIAYEVAGRCPRSHPVRVPSLTLIVRYPVTRGAGLALASGGVHSGHADFFNAWNQEALATIVRECSRALPHCGRH